MFPFGLETMPGVQGCIADATVDILESWEVTPVFKSVDNFNFMQEPSDTIVHKDGSIGYTYQYTLADVIKLTDKLGIPWHPIEKKGHDFMFSATYVGFDWDLCSHSVSLPSCKHEKYATRMASYLKARKVSLEETMKIHGTLQHVTFILSSGSSYLPSLSHAIKARAKSTAIIT